MADPFVPADPDLRRLLKEMRTVAVVGLSDNPMRPSYGVARYLHEVGYRVVPVNPKLTSLWGLKAYPDLESVRRDGLTIDLVDVFRDPAHVPAVVEEAIRVGAKAIWLQEGVVHEEAARRALEAGLVVVMDLCAMKEHARLVG
jgi:uncharacterized protein